MNVRCPVVLAVVRPCPVKVHGLCIVLPLPLGLFATLLHAMRRSALHATDDLNLLLRAVLEFRAQDGNHLPGYAEPIMFFLGMQPEGSAGMRELRERLGLGQSRTSRLCAALGRAGLVEVVTPNEDRRASLVKLTPKGARLVDKVLAAFRSRSR